MAFNSDTYHRSKAKRQTKVYMQHARNTEGERRAFWVRLARCEWRIYLSCLRIERIKRDYKRMLPRDFVRLYGDVW